MNFHLRCASIVMLILGLLGSGCRKEAAPPAENQTQPTQVTGQQPTPPAQTPEETAQTPQEAQEESSTANPTAKETTAEGGPQANEVAADTTSSELDPEITIIEEPNKQGGLRLRRQVKTGPDGKAINHGKVLEYMETGELWKESHWVEGEKHGPYTEWYRNGQISQLGEFDHGKMVKVWTWFYDTGGKQKEGAFSAENQRHGTWTYWDREGKKLREELWDNGMKQR